MFTTISDHDMERVPPHAVQQRRSLATFHSQFNSLFVVRNDHRMYSGINQHVDGCGAIVYSIGAVHPHQIQMGNPTTSSPWNRVLTRGVPVVYGVLCVSVPAFLVETIPEMERG